MSSIYVFESETGDQIFKTLKIPGHTPVINTRQKFVVFLNYSFLWHENMFSFNFSIGLLITSFILLHIAIFIILNYIELFSLNLHKLCFCMHFKSKEQSIFSVLQLFVFVYS